MKYTLTITSDNPAELAGVLASLRGGSVASEDDNGPVNVTAPAVDNTGLPWDERIHASSKALTGEGKWRSKRGVGDDMISSVTAELRARGPVQQPAAPQPPMTPLPVPPAPVNFVPPPPMPVAPVSPPMPVAPVSPPMPVATGPLDFSGFMGIISNLLQSGQVDAGYLASLVVQINTACGTQLQAITDLDKHPQLLEWTVQLMRSNGKPC